MRYDEWHVVVDAAAEFIHKRGRAYPRSPSSPALLLLRENARHAAEPRDTRDDLAKCARDRRRSRRLCFAREDGKDREREREREREGERNPA